eukprot:CAMPEP_0185372276 /NCGR_PEP_ID=MMETSP1364-20130426/25333_1 /TAXON_ID=38817 /ORGANISM="Gephyrocapsa oceanica, Strain RCC1303" /LENGTH=80 /DNA_ID=CAMNT_0027973229 /DNA_START=45 /DNA_END=284 /DNA_ORIENTATION=-
MPLESTLQSCRVCPRLALAAAVLQIPPYIRGVVLVQHDHRVARRQRASRLDLALQEAGPVLSPCCRPQLGEEDGDGAAAP